MGSRSRLCADVKSTGLSPDQAERAVRLAASGWRPLDIRESVVWETPVSFADGFPGRVACLYRGAESGIEGREIELGGVGSYGAVRRQAGEVLAGN